MSVNHKAVWKVLLTLLMFGLIILATGKVASAQSQTGWRGEYYNNMTLSGSPALVRVDRAIDFDWGAGSPEWGVVGADNFSVRWTGNINVSPGRYRFVMSTDDGGRLWINGQLVLDKWLDQQGGYHEVSVDLPNGSAYVQVEYYENQGGAKALMAYMRQSGSSGGSGSGPWRGEYYNSKNLSGQPALIRNEGDINFNWGSGSPASGTINADNFSARWTRQVDLMPGRYQFATTTDDGVRLWVNNQLIIDQWRDQNPTTHRAEIDLPGGRFPIKMEYFEDTGGAKAQLSWAIISGGAPGGVPATGAWRVEYFNNIELSGAPALVRDEGQPNYNWGYGSPSPGAIGNDYFSVRWSRSQEFLPGRYRFTATTDDGVRLWVNNQLIINNWRNQAASPQSAEINLAGGIVPIRMEYYEADVLAEARLSWQRVGASANTGGAPAASVTSASLNVRQGPGTTYAIISRLSYGQLVQLAGIRNADATWVKVILPDGRQGWTYAGYLQSNVPFSGFAVEGGQPPPASGLTATVTNASQVNVRTGPGVGNSILTSLARGTTVTLLGRNANSSWAKIHLASGATGWMNAYYLSSVTPISTLAVTS